MKAKEHLATHLGILIALLVILYLFIHEKIFTILNFNGLICIGLYFLGAILPDSDSNNKGSYIYYKGPLVIIAHLVSWLEAPISKFITKRKIEHRQSLHTVVGVLITSAFVIVILTIICIGIYPEFQIAWIFPWFISLFVGQYLHLVEDLQADWKISWK